MRGNQNVITTPNKMKYAVLFQGQGKYDLHYVQELYKKSNIVKRIIDKANNMLDYSLIAQIMNENGTDKYDTDYAQMIIFVSEYACYKYFEENFPQKPAYYAGHSLGEITALTAAGAISFEDAVRVVALRGKLMKNSLGEKPEGMMAIRDVPYERLNQLCKQIEVESGNCIVCANYNSANQIVLSGHKEGLDTIKRELPENTCKYLEVTHAFHSPLMAGVKDEFNTFLKQLQFFQLNVPVVSSVTACPYVASWSIPEILTTQLTANVIWKSVIDYLEERGCIYFMQVTDSKLFKLMDNSLNKNHLWIEPEQLYGNVIFDFNSLYTKASDNSFVQGMIVGDILSIMIAFPWNSMATKEQVEWARKEYTCIQANYIKYHDEDIEISENELFEYISVLEKILDLKNLQGESKEIIIKNLLGKYGLKGKKNG